MDAKINAVTLFGFYEQATGNVSICFFRAILKFKIFKTGHRKI